MLLKANFDAGTNGATIATSDAGSVNAWDAVSIGSGSTLIYDTANTHSSPNASKHSSGASAGNEYYAWTTASIGSLATLYGRIYLYPTTNFNGSQIVTIRDNIGQEGALSISGAGANKLQILNASASVVATSTNSIPLNGFTRIEWNIIAGNPTGSFVAKLFLAGNVDGTTPDETLTPATNGSLVLGANVQEVRFGSQANDANLVFWIDDIEVNDSGYPGPLPVAGPLVNNPVWPRVRFNG